MNKSVTSAIACALLAFTQTAFTCEYPKRAEIPDGATASKDEMLAGQSSVKTFMAAMDEYLTCIDKEEKDTLAKMADISDEERLNREAALTKKHNAAVEEMELTAARFNEEVRAYKAQSD